MTFPKAKRGILNKFDDEAVAARKRVIEIIDAIPPEDLVSSIKRAPSLRGMILGYIAEEMFEKHIPKQYPVIVADDIKKHDDHNREYNKSDRTIFYKGHYYRVQLKSVQTNTICRNVLSGLLQADVQNDASDARTVTLPNGSALITTCYVRGEYEILAVPLFPFTGEWNYAYKNNLDCRASQSKKYRPDDAKYLLATTEKITWPLSENWHLDLVSLLRQV